MQKLMIVLAWLKGFPIEDAFQLVDLVVDTGKHFLISVYEVDPILVLEFLNDLEVAELSAIQHFCCLGDGICDMLDVDYWLVTHLWNFFCILL